MLNTTNENKIDANIFIGDAFVFEFNHSRDFDKRFKEEYEPNAPDKEYYRAIAQGALDDFIETYNKIDDNDKIDAEKLARSAANAAAALYNYYSLAKDGYERHCLERKLKREIGENYFAIDDED